MTDKNTKFIPYWTLEPDHLVCVKTKEQEENGFCEFCEEEDCLCSMDGTC